MQPSAMPPVLAKRAVILFLALGGAIVAANPALAQPMAIPPVNGPRLLHVMPAGGRAGSTFEVTVDGPGLTQPQGLHFSHPGIKAEAIGIDVTSPAVEPTPKKKKAGMLQPQGSVRQRFRVTLPAETPPGIHDVRFVNAKGVSNPRAFVVGDLKEFVEKEPNNDVEQAQRIDLNSTVHGVIASPIDVDYFVFAGKRGQRVVVSCLASSIDSRLQPALEMYSSAGSQLAFNRNYRGSDALLDAKLPEDGDYQVRVSSFAYVEGGPDHFYRLTVSTAPWIDAVFPPVVEPGKQATLTVYGRNLPGGKLDPAAVVDGRVLEKATVMVDIPKEPLGEQRLDYLGLVNPASTMLDGFGYRLHNDAGSSNAFLLTYARAPVVLGNGANGSRDTAQPVPLPCEIAGMIEKKGERDWYAFHARQGNVYSIEVYADRLGSPLDPYFAVINAAGKVLIGPDDNPAPAKLGLMDMQFFTRCDDPPRYRFVAPADGTYHLQVGSREAFLQAGPRHLYRVRITPEQPDFRLVAMPVSTLGPDAGVVGAEGNEAFTVFAWRLDGFSGEIALTGVDLPPGLRVPPQIVPAGQAHAVLGFSAAADAKPWTGVVHVRGTATINGKRVVREIRSATISWPVPQVNIPTITRLDRELVLAVRERPPFTLSVETPEVTFPLVAPISVPVKLRRLAPNFKAAVQVVALNLPPGWTMQPVTLTPGKDEARVTLTPKGKLAPERYSLVFRGQTGAVQPKQQGNKIIPIGEAQSSPPVLVTLVPKEVAKITLTPANALLKAGKEVELKVRVTRLHGYEGPLTLRLVLPSGTKGVSAEETTIAAGKDEARFRIHADAGAAVGPRAGLRMEATALFQGRLPITQEVKLGVNVAR